MHEHAWAELGAIDFVAAFYFDGERVELLRRRLYPDVGVTWQEVEVSLDTLAGRAGELDLHTEVVKGRLAYENFAFWAPPALRCSSSDERPNIVLVSIDTLRADHLGCYGYGRNTSPTLDRMAREGVLFRQTIAPSSWTLPSHASMLTGLNPRRHTAVRFSGSRIALTVATLPELLWKSGYTTAAFTDGGFVSGSFGFERGFEQYVSKLTTYPGEGLPVGARPGDVKDLFSENIERADAWMRSTEGQPFFLFLHTYAVHLPYAPPPPYDRMFDPEYDGPCRTQLRGELVSECLRDDETAPLVLRHMKALYDGEIRHMDTRFEGFMGRLQSSGLAERTCIIVTSDHGEEFQEHGRLFHSRADLYEELIRVPLIVWCPTRFTAGRIVDAPVSSLDIAPTILELADVPVPEDLDGASLMPTLLGRRSPPRATILSEVDASIEKSRPDGTTAAVRTDRYKLVASSTTGTAQLFDLYNDPGETEDVSSTMPDVVLRLRAALSASSLAHPAAAPAAPHADAAATDPALRERLRALGYGD